MPDVRSLSTGTKVVLGSAILLLLVSFLNWQDVGEVAGLPVDVPGISAWHGFWGWMMGLLTIAMIVWVGLQVMSVSLPELPVPAKTITLGLGVLIFAFALIKNLADDYSTIWSYIGVVLAAAVAVGAWLRSQEPELVAAPTSRPPTPETP
jgi:hypothetical protein